MQNGSQRNGSAHPRLSRVWAKDDAWGSELLHDEVQQSTGDGDHFYNRLAFQVLAHGFVGFGESLEFSGVDPVWNDNLASELSVDLDRNFDRVFHQHGRVILRPRFVRHGLRMAKCRPKFFRNVRSKRAQQLHE